MITLESSTQNPSCVDTFLALPAILHGNHPCWTPRPISDCAALLDTRQNPYWKQAERELFVARLDGQPVGRIAAVDDREYASKFQNDLGFFSFFDCIDNQAIANALVAAAARWLKQRGRKQMRGPYGPSPILNQDQGIQISGFDYKQATGEPFHEPFCQRLLEACAMTKSTDCLAFRLPGNAPAEVLNDRMRRGLKAKKSLSIRPFDITRKEHDMNVVRTVMRDVYSSAVVPIFSSEREMAALEATNINGDWGLTFLALVKNEPAGFYIAVPNTDDLFQKHPEQLCLPAAENGPYVGDAATAAPGDNQTCGADGAKIISGTVVEFAVARAHQRSLVAAGLLCAYWDAVCARGYQYNTAYCIDEGNTASISLSTVLNGEIVKRMRLYDCDISHAVTLSHR